MRRALLLLLLPPLLVTACGGAAAPAPRRGGTARDAERRAEIFWNREQTPVGPRLPAPLVRGTIGGRATIFVLDTGAETSAIDAPFASKLEGGGVKRTSTPAITLDGWGPVGDRPTAVLDLPEELRTLGVGGVLSPQTLVEPGREVLLDLAHGELRETVAGEADVRAVFGRQPSLALSDMAVCRYAQDGFDARMLVAAATMDGAPIALAVDTGSVGTFVSGPSPVGRQIVQRPTAAKTQSPGPAGMVDTTVVTGVALAVGDAKTFATVLVTPDAADPHCRHEGRLGIGHLKSCALLIGPTKTTGACASGTSQ